jgi:hypothetical protein
LNKRPRKESYLLLQDNEEDRQNEEW